MVEIIASQSVRCFQSCRQHSSSSRDMRWVNIPTKSWPYQSSPLNVGGEGKLTARLADAEKSSPLYRGPTIGPRETVKMFSQIKVRYELLNVQIMKKIKTHWAHPKRFFFSVPSSMMEGLRIRLHEVTSDSACIVCIINVFCRFCLHFIWHTLYNLVNNCCVRPRELLSASWPCAFLRLPYRH